MVNYVPLVLLPASWIGSSIRYLVAELYAAAIMKHKTKANSLNDKDDVVDDVTKLRYELPWATLTVNIAGALIAGVLTGLYQRYSPDGSPTSGTGEDGKGGIESILVQDLLTTGFLGCLTTLSSYHLELLLLTRIGTRRHWLVFTCYVLITNVLGFSCYVIGMLMSDWIVYLSE